MGGILPMVNNHLYLNGYFHRFWVNFPGAARVGNAKTA